MNILTTSCHSYILKNENRLTNIKADQGILEMLSPSVLLKNIEKDIHKLEEEEEEQEKRKRVEKVISTIKNRGRYVKTKNNKKLNIFSVMSTPTNTRKVYLLSKTGYYLQMNANGVVNGSRHVNRNGKLHMQIHFLYLNILKFLHRMID